MSLTDHRKEKTSDKRSNVKSSMHGAAGWVARRVRPVLRATGKFFALFMQ